MRLMRTCRHPQGFTLVEVVVGIALFVTGAATLLLGMHYAMIHSSFVRQSQVAMNAAQARLEQLASQGIDALVNADSANGTMVGAMTDRFLETPAGGTPLADDDVMTNARLAIQIRSVPPGAAPPLNLLDLHVAACWTHRGRTIGEGGANGAGVPLCQDTSGNAATWAVDSPAMVSTRIARRD